MKKLVILISKAVQPEPVAMPEPDPIIEADEAEISAAHEPEPLTDPEPDPFALTDPDMADDAHRFAKADAPMRLVDPERPHIAHLVGKDLSDPAIWRHTELVDGEPFQHADYETADAAFVSALRAGGIPAYDDAGETS